MVTDPIVPHWDPRLGSSSRAQAEFVSRLERVGLIAWRRRERCRVGAFFVRKKADGIRLVLDCRPRLVQHGFGSRSLGLCVSFPMDRSHAFLRFPGKSRHRDPFRRAFICSYGPGGPVIDSSLPGIPACGTGVHIQVSYRAIRPPRSGTAGDTWSRLHAPRPRSACRLATVRATGRGGRA